jgi:hypothetical protein
MQYTQEEKLMLENVNKIGMNITSFDDNFIFVQLSPYLDHLMIFLKRLNSTEMQMVFMRYEGVMKFMRMSEEYAQQMEKELGLK